MTLIPRKVSPLLTKVIEADGLCSSASWQELSRQTAALIRCGGHCHQYSWLDPDYAPFVDFDASTPANTWSSFTIGDTSGSQYCDWDLPWYVHPGHETVVMECTLVSRHQLPLAFRFSTKTLFTAVSTSTSEGAVAMTTWAPVQSEKWKVKLAGTDLMLRSMTKRDYLKDPDLVAARWVLIEPEIQIAATTTTSIIDRGGDYRVYLESYTIYDTLDERAYG